MEELVLKFEMQAALKHVGTIERVHLAREAGLQMIAAHQPQAIAVRDGHFGRYPNMSCC